MFNRKAGIYTCFKLIILLFVFINIISDFLGNDKGGMTFRTRNRACGYFTFTLFFTFTSLFFCSFSVFSSYALLTQKPLKRLGQMVLLTKLALLQKTEEKDKPQYSPSFKHNKNLLPSKMNRKRFSGLKYVPSQTTPGFSTRN